MTTRTVRHAQGRDRRACPLLPLTAMILLGVALLASCGGNVVTGNAVTRAVDAEGGSYAPADTVASADVLPDALPWPEAPEGAPSLDDLEDIYQRTMAFLAEGEIDHARDHFFTLQHYALAPAPADADPAYLEHRRSFERRLELLGGLLAEQRAFSEGPAAADSLLATEYAALEGLAFPDSLVPATGTILPPLRADLLKVNNAKVQQWQEYFCNRGRKNFQLWLERKAECDSLITSVLTENGLPPELIYLALIESGLSNRAKSSAGAVGFWQFMPGTGAMYGLRRDYWVDERRDLERATRAASAYLKRLYAEFNDWALVLAAYNSGEGRVRRQMRATMHDDYWSHSLPRETSDYVPKFIAAVKIGENPEAFGFTTPPPRPLGWERIPVSNATDLDLVATCAGVDASAVAALNPHLLRGSTPPGAKDYPVYVPAGTAAVALRELAKVPQEQRLTWRRHRVQRGETLGGIARTYGITVGAIQRANEMSRKTMIHPGDQLLIPMPGDLKELAAARQVGSQKSGTFAPTEGQQRVSYKVKKGDTLGRVAKRLGVSVQHLRKVNKLRGDTIKPGQRIYAYKKPGK
jgi:membrane-bound lytic murein transglycosylase D